VGGSRAKTKKKKEKNETQKVGSQGPKNHLHGKQQTVLHMFLDTFACNAAVQQFVALSTPEELRQKKQNKKKIGT